MNDFDPAFERQVADVAQRAVGPPRPVDAMAIAREASSISPKRRFHSMFSTVKFVVAGAVVALFGGFLLAGLLSTESGEPLPGPAVSPTAAAVISGRVSTLEVQRPRVAARLVVTLVEASAGPDAPPLGTFIYEEPVRTGPPQDVEDIPFILEYPSESIVDGRTYVLVAKSFETESGRVFAIINAPLPVITQGNPVDGVELQLIPTPDDGTVPQVTGTIVAASDLPDPIDEARVIISLHDAMGAQASGEPISEVSLGGVRRLRPPRSFVLDYAPDTITDDGSYILQAQLVDDATGAVLGVSAESVDVITAGHSSQGIRIDLVPNVE